MKILWCLAKFVELDYFELDTLCFVELKTQHTSIFVKTRTHVLVYTRTCTLVQVRYNDT